MDMLIPMAWTKRIAEQCNYGIKSSKSSQSWINATGWMTVRTGCSSQYSCPRESPSYSCKNIHTVVILIIGLYLRAFKVKYHHIAVLQSQKRLLNSKTISNIIIRGVALVMGFCKNNETQQRVNSKNTNTVLSTSQLYRTAKTSRLLYRLGVFQTLAKFQSLLGITIS